jgi:hypothetical protein
MKFVVIDDEETQPRLRGIRVDRTRLVRRESLSKHSSRRQSQL